MIDKLAIYERMALLSTEMVDAARRSDWDQLGALEKMIAALRDELQVADISGYVDDGASRARKIELIHRMLADDRTIRSFTEPWMDSVRTLLSGNARQRKLSAAYNVG
jgi:flagellar protein FliT